MRRDAYYRSGQAGEVLGISVHLVRRLIECGLLEAEQTPGGQYRIPLKEIERLKEEGIPPIPSSPELDDDESESMTEEDEGQERRLLGPPSNRVVTSAEDVVVDENQLKKLKIKREMEQERDWFRERRRQKAEQNTEEKRAAAEHAARAEADIRRKAWSDDILQETLRNLPSEVPSESYFEVQQSIEDALTAFGPQTPRDVIDRSVQKAIGRVLAPWQRIQDTSRAIKEASDRLPWPAKMPFNPTKWQIRAQEAAADAIAELPDNAHYEQKLRVANAAVQPVSEEFEDLGLKERIILNSMLLWEGTQEEREDARGAVRKALTNVPPGTSERELERVRDQALKPFHTAIEARKAQVQKQQRVERLLGHISNYLDRLQQDDEIEFGSYFERHDFVEELKPQLRQAILEKLKKVEMTDRQIESLIERLTDDAIDGFDDEDETNCEDDDDE